MRQSRPLFVYFRPFLITISIIRIEKSIDVVLGIQTRGRMMIGADNTTELWRPPSILKFVLISPFFALLNVYFSVSLFRSGPARSFYCHLRFSAHVHQGEGRHQAKEVNLAFLIKISSQNKLHRRCLFRQTAMHPTRTGGHAVHLFKEQLSIQAKGSQCDQTWRNIASLAKFWK